ncbi:MAG: hypothetical protein A2Y76_01585 [Planctomycetes bacterium RBG_13_60_9]|nr:MAG: hypothetical protein A2Y76_01585 [Planctomycetes bacterium RBG_13_60_9]
MDGFKLRQDIMFVRLAQGLPRQSRKIQAEADIEPSRLRASARLYSGDAFGQIKAFDASTRDVLTRLTIDIPACFRSSYVLPLTMIDRVTGFLGERQAKRAALIDAFLGDSYTGEREAARDALRDSFRETDFPEPDVLRKAFTMDWSIFKMAVPEGLPENVMEQERAKFAEQLESVFVQCRAALRESMADLVGHLADRLAPNADGSRKRLAASTVEKLREFLDTVNSRDVTSDDSIRELSDKARAVIGTYSADDLRGGLFGSRVREGLVAVKSELETLIERDGGRKIDLDM